MLLEYAPGAKVFTAFMSFLMSVSPPLGHSPEHLGLQLVERGLGLGFGLPAADDDDVIGPRPGCSGQGREGETDAEEEQES
ncbi:hypothetical protein KH5H1_26510 [Corallococcus caeni]|nr:hypothetical protein KH5H1_26510 [Corallococcus sp. KH5-1]